MLSITIQHQKSIVVLANTSLITPGLNLMTRSAECKFAQKVNKNKRIRLLKGEVLSNIVCGGLCKTVCLTYIGKWELDLSTKV
jgi:hypothetical protein